MRLPRQFAEAHLQQLRRRRPFQQHAQPLPGIGGLPMGSGLLQFVAESFDKELQQTQTEQQPAEVSTSAQLPHFQGHRIVRGKNAERKIFPGRRLLEEILLTQRD